MIDGEVARKARGDMSRFIRDKSRAKKVLQEKTVRFYREYILEGRSDAEARELCIERLEDQGLTKRKLRNYVENPAAVSNPKALALSDAKVAVWLDKTMCDIDEVREECNEQLDEIEGLDYSEWLEVEETDDSAAKGGITTKTNPVGEVRLALLERKLKALEPFYTAIRNLRGNSPILNVSITGGTHETTIEELDYEITELEKQNRIEDGNSPQE